ncbi:unnamed protein product [Adineta steineri]|uniref:Uncharacterized protein n=1 Tax=Adineta steineri TaxID=433720 RepID=A0A818YZ81_9BILA|nr:unnamed protein product [Adineta steineri]
MMNSRANVRPYNPHVLIGNWLEDRVMEEEVLNNFLDKRYSGQLASQKMTEVERMSQSLFLSCVRSSTRSARTCDVIFTNNRNRDSIWVIMHPSSHLRLEFEGTEVKIDDKVVLAHASSNKCLSVNEEHSNRSPYGREYELLCELSTGSNSSYKSPILWKFQTQSAY